MGSLHLGNILESSKMRVSYIVEADQARWEPCRKGWGLAKVNKSKGGVNIVEFQEF